MKILYILQEFPFPPNNGIRWKIYNLLNYMAKKHECHIISFGMPNELERAKDWCSSLPGLKVLDIFPQPFNLKQRINQVLEIVKGNPPSLGRWKSQEFANAICRALKENSYDVVHLDMINMAQYWPILQNIPTVLSVNDAVSMRYLRFSNIVKNHFKKNILTSISKRISLYETKIFPKFTSIHIVSKVDADYLLSLNHNLNIQVVSICVHPDYLKIPIYQNDYNQFNKREFIIFTSGSLKDNYIATPLLQFVQNGFRKIRLIYPNIKFIIIGQGASKKIATFLLSEKGVQFKPWVEDYVQILESADIAIFLDEAGSGIKNRVLQALTAGKAVVGTPCTFEGIEIINNLNALKCESLDDVTRAILILIKDNNLRFRLGYAARKLIQSLYTQEITGEQWEKVYRQAIISYATKNSSK